MHFGVYQLNSYTNILNKFHVIALSIPVEFDRDLRDRRDILQGFTRGIGQFESVLNIFSKSGDIITTPFSHRHKSFCQWDFFVWQHRFEEEPWILDVIKDLVAAFNAEFSVLWHGERRGVLFPQSLFEDQQHDASVPLQAKQREIWEDALGFCGIEMHRRTLTLAHNADFESIEDASFRGELEAQNLKAGARLIIERHGIADVDAFLATIQATEAAGR